MYKISIQFFSQYFCSFTVLYIFRLYIFEWQKDKMNSFLQTNKYIMLLRTILMYFFAMEFKMEWYCLGKECYLLSRVPDKVLHPEVEVGGGLLRAPTLQLLQVRLNTNNHRTVYFWHCFRFCQSFSNKFSLFYKRVCIFLHTLALHEQLLE